MLGCPVCHIEYPEGKKFCKNCGSALIPLISEPKEEGIAEPFISPEREASPEVHEEAEYQGILSTESGQMPMQCPDCGAVYEEGKPFCKNCGAALTPQSIKAREKLTPLPQETRGFILPDKMAKKAKIKAGVKEGRRLSREKDKLESLLANLERQRDMIPAPLFKETQRRYAQQLSAINKRLQEIESISAQARTQLDIQIRTLKKELEPFQSDYASIRSLYKAGGLVRKDFRQNKKGLKRQILTRERQFRKKRKLLKVISSSLSQEGFIPQPVWYKTRLARFALIWPSICLGALLLIGGSYYIAASYFGWWLPFSSPASTTIFSATTGPPPKIEALPETGKSLPLIESAITAETDPIKKILENIKAANIKKDINLFLSCYSSSYPDLDARKEATLKNWEAFDFIDLIYNLKEKEVEGDKARLTVEWTTKTISREDGQVYDSKSLLTVLLRKEEGAWKIIQTEQKK